MEHLFLRLFGRAVLIADVHRSTDGQGIGYGTLLIRTRRVFLLGQIAKVPVFCLPWRKAVNSAVTRLESDAVDIIPPDSWRGRCLTVIWYLAAPFRIGDPRLWAARTTARFILGPFYGWVERTTILPRRVRRYVLRQTSLFRTLKAVNIAYATRSDRLWRQTHEMQVLSRLRAMESAGQPVPPLRLRLPAAREAQARRDAERLGIDPGKPLVTVHVREAGYRSTAGLRQRDWDDVRNARIETFVAAFKTLVKAGYTVVRLGDQTMTPVDVPGVVDLATAAARDQWLDIWCTMRSDFLIGSDSGPSWLAILLDVPILTVNAVHFRDLSRPADRIICKLARDRTTGEILSISEMLTEDFLRTGFKGDRYECVDNTGEDIRRAVLDMIEVVRGRESRTSWQERFNRQLRNAERQRIAGSALQGVAIMGRPRGTLSRGFARTYFVRDRAAAGEVRPKS